MNDLFIDEALKLMAFQPQPWERTKPIYMLFKDFYERKKVVKAYELARVDWSDFLWLLDWIMGTKDYEEFKNW